VLLVHGDADGLVNSQQSSALHNALTDAGHDSQLMLLAGANHEDPAFHKPAVLAATAGFLSAALSAR
jgi:dipeptidyl aminopeptidase/acylaminoacyl peptidase